MVKDHVGEGVALNSDGGSKGDGLYDGGVSQSPFAKAARRVTRESHTVLHAGVDHSAKQYSRFSVIEIPQRATGFTGVPRGRLSGKRRVRMTVTINHVERYHRTLKSHVPRNLSLAEYSVDPDLWLMNAAWRCRLIGDPFLKLALFLRGDNCDDADVESESDDDDDLSDESDDDSSSDGN